MSVDTWLAITGVILGVVAIAMAISPFAQMLWGRPELIFEFTEFTGPDGKDLIFTIKNRPVTSAFLRRIGVRRDTGEINASINVLEQGTNRVLLMQIPAIINDPVERKFGLVAHARPHFHAAFTVIHCRQAGPALYDPRAEAYLTIAAGNYIARIQVLCGDQHYQHDRLFRADNDPVLTNWL